MAIAPFEVTERWEPCKRASLDRQLAAAIGETRRYAKRPPALRKGASGNVGLGVYVVAGTGKCWFQSAEDNEDMGDMRGANWTVSLYLRRATAEETSRDEQVQLRAGLPAVFAAMNKCFRQIEEKHARVAMAAAAAADGYAQVELAYVAALGDEAQQARKAARMVWQDGKGSYVATWEMHGQTWFESHRYLYDFDQPIIVVGPRAIIERAAIAQSIVGLGWAIGNVVRAMDRAQKAT